MGPCLLRPNPPDGHRGHFFHLVQSLLKRLGLWEVKARPPPKANALPKYKPYIDYSHRGVCPYGPEANSQLPVPTRCPIGVSDKWLYIDPKYPKTYTG